MASDNVVVTCAVVLKVPQVPNYIAVSVDGVTDEHAKPVVAAAGKRLTYQGLIQ